LVHHRRLSRAIDLVVKSKDLASGLGSAGGIRKNQQRIVLMKKVMAVALVTGVLPVAAGAASWTGKASY